MTRALTWDGCLNVRDLGGVPLEGGGETRFRTLIRADSVRRLTDDGWHSLAGHGIRRVVDLRWQEELADDPPRDIDVEVVHVSLLGSYDPAVDGDMDGFVSRRDIVGFRVAGYSRWLERYRGEFAKALAALADADGPAVFHCTSGKDRTGLVAALVLRLAGASIDEIATDYALSERNVLTGDEEVEEYFLRATPAEGMALTLSALESRHGSVRDYLRGCGLDEARMALLRDRLRVNPM